MEKRGLQAPRTTRNNQHPSVLSWRGSGGVVWGGRGWGYLERNSPHPGADATVGASVPGALQGLYKACSARDD